MTANIQSRRFGLLRGVAVLALAAASPAWAQVAGQVSGQSGPPAASNPPTSAQDADPRPQPLPEGADPADAQVDGDELEAVVVTGFRRSLENSIAVKREADTVVEVISAEDIGRLPDVSIAEALARLPGVTSQRTGGQASAINIRGLSQDLVSSTLNGREQVATSGNRTIEFDQYPSELINQAQVYKSPKASLIEGGVAGKVELRTARPLDRNEPVLSLNIRGSYNDRADQSADADEYGYRISGSYQGQFMNDTLGVAVGYARLRQPNVATRFVGFDYTGSSLDLNNNGTTEAIGFGFEAIQFGGNETRDGLLGVIQYEPNDRLSILVDGYYSKFTSDVFRRGFRVFGTQNATTASLTNPVIVDDVIVGGRFAAGTGLGYENVSQDEGDQDELYSYGLNVAYDLTDRLTVSGDLSFSKANSYFYNSGLTLSPAALLPGDAVTYRLNGLELADIAFSRNLSDPAALRFQNFYIVPQEDDDQLTAFQGDLKYEVGGVVDSVEFGVRFASREAERTITSFNSFNIPAPVTLTPDLYSIGGFEGDFGKYPNFLVVNIDAVLDRFVGENRSADQAFNFTREQSFTISEDVASAYGMVNLDTTLGGRPLSGNLGLRVVQTEQSSASVISVNGQLQNTERGDRYTEVLPSANFVLELADDNLLRVSASRQISRPRFFELRNSAGVGVSSAGVPSGGGGNPALRPFLANQFDITYERYFGRTGVLVLGAFYKDLESFIIGGSIPNFNFVEAGISFPPPQAGAPPTQPTGAFFLPINGEGGKVYGFEFAYTQSFDFLPAPFDGLGVVINYAYADSSLSFTNGLSGRSLSIPLPGLSKHVSNPTIFYEKAGFSTRLGLRYRSDFVAPQIGLNEQITGIDSELVADAQVSYEFQDGSQLEGLTLLLQANNFTDEPTKSFFGTEAQTGTIQYFGRQFFLGASYTF